MISLLHPSRSRCDKAKKTANEWLSKAGMKVQYIASIDSDDPEAFEYTLSFQNKHLLINHNTCVVEATNHAAKECAGDILVYLSDDFKCPDNWALELVKKFHGVTSPMLLKVDDCLQKFEVPVLTIPIMNRALYETLGYFWYPEYKSMFVDEDLYWTCVNLGALRLAPDLKFPHEHCSVGKAENDLTYKRSAANWDQGKALFQKRKLKGFPL